MDIQATQVPRSRVRTVVASVFSRKVFLCLLGLRGCLGLLGCLGCLGCLGLLGRLGCLGRLGSLGRSEYWRSNLR